MPIQPNFLERTAFFTLNAAPAPMLDLAWGLALQVINTAVQLNLFTALQERPSTPTELAQCLHCQERGLEKLLAALAAIGYVVERNGRYHNSAMTTKWFLLGDMLDMRPPCWSLTTFFGSCGPMLQRWCGVGNGRLTSTTSPPARPVAATPTRR